MTIKTTTATIKAAAPFPESRLKLSRTPLLDMLRREVAKQAGTVIDRKSAQTAVTDVISRKQSLEGALLGFARGASKALNTVVREERRIAEREERANAQYRESLVARRREKKPGRLRRVRKEEYGVAGQVRDPKTGEPVPGVVVEAIDKNVAKYDVLGVDITDAGGRYQIAFTAKDFEESDETPPEVVMRVGLDRRRALLVTDDIVMLQAGERASLDIVLSDDATGAAERIVASRQRLDKQRLGDVSQTAVLNRVEHRAAQEVGTVIEGLLGRAVAFLEGRVRQGPRTKTKSEKQTEPEPAAQVEPKSEVGAAEKAAPKPTTEEKTRPTAETVKKRD